MSQRTVPVRFRPNLRRGLSATVIMIILVATGLSIAGIAIFLNGGDSGTTINPILAEVQRGEFISRVLDQGEIQSSENVEIRCEVEARNGQVTVIEVVPEGTRVKEGDFLVQLDSTSFDKELETQKIAVTTAETAVIQAEADLEVAKEAKNEYVEGTFKQTMLEIENEIADALSAIETAKQELEQARAVLDHSEKLAQKGFITNQQREADEFAVERAQLALQKGNNSLALAETKKRVYKEITFNKEIIQYDSDIKAANVRLNNQREASEVEKASLAEIKDNIAKCTVRVPKGVQGQVVYAKESSRGGNDWILEEGTTVRERQVLIRLPNPDKMEVKALINEQSITSISPGMPAEVRVDALNAIPLKGVVTKVNQYAESSGWMGSSVRKYAVLVRILDPPPALKPGMNASVSIQVRYEPDALMAPIQTVYAVGDQQFCLVKKGDNVWETREIEVEADNSQNVLISSGVEPGEQLVMNPGAFKDLMDLPEQKLEQRIEVPEEEIAQAEQGSQPGPMGPRGDDADGRSGMGGGPEGPGRGGPGGPGGAGGGGPGGGGFSVDMIVDRTMERYDTNGDGLIDATEQESFDERAQRMAGADTDGDGNISRDEIRKTMEEMMKRFQGGGGGAGGGQ